MPESATPLVSHVIQDRPIERSRVCSPGTNTESFDLAVDLLNNDDQLPVYLKTVLGHVVERISSMELLLKKNYELEERLKAEIAEKNKLKDEIEVLKSALSKSSVAHPSQMSMTSLPASKVGNNSAALVAPTNSPPCTCFCEEKERLRSVVVSGISESRDVNAINRMNYDHDCVKKLFHFLNIECNPVCFYRMGKPNPRFPRLLKIVFPSTYFRNDILRKAPRLKTFPVSGVYIRPSLPKEERDRLRALRLAKLNRSEKCPDPTTEIVSPEVDSSAPLSSSDARAATDSSIQSVISENR
ncbi:hypothetical protein Y032_0358g3410 [Ancylostoma ceylanicum]|uniref:Uncharacterized protein n=1 Tax=Ancylostoma ceylanicum TaxID=53326 RepID=A0A016RW33_9BILA|nr:hypothetical protein Y032_0358g3410 [Ancylostoma ceylanicum]